MGDERELKLNSIDRYVKDSPNFVLEEYTHCEVPAGCGGVVLRWRDPMAPVPVKLQLWLSVDSHGTYVDGSAPSSSRPSIRPGSHVLMIAATLESRQPVQLLFRAVADPDSPTTILTSGGVNAGCRARSTKGASGRLYPACAIRANDYCRPICFG